MWQQQRMRGVEKIEAYEKVQTDVSDGGHRW